MNEDNIYRKKECELCGKYAFEKFIKTAKELDGGFTRIEEWEESQNKSVNSIAIGEHIISLNKIKELKEEIIEVLSKDLDEKFEKSEKEIESSLDEIKEKGVASPSSFEVVNVKENEL